MALDVKTAKEIQDFVYLQPRTIQDVARLIGKNWRTAEAYVDEIIKQYGTVGVKVFRPGTKAALKIVYWAHVEKLHSSQAQEELLLEIKGGRAKGDFDPFDIYQMAERRAFDVKPTKEGSSDEIVRFISGTKQVLLNFSGNLSWAGQPKCALAIKRLASEGVSIKILARIDVASMKNLQAIDKINRELGHDAIEVRHRHQPLRGFISDSKKAQLKDEKEKGRYKSHELDEDMFIFYTLEDERWAGWLEKVFWHLYSQSPPAHDRIAELKAVKQRMLAAK